MFQRRNRNRKRKRGSAEQDGFTLKDGPSPGQENHKILSNGKHTPASNMSNMLRKQPVWLILAVASGACAAINGVFAKLTTTALTTSWSHAIALAFSLSPTNKVVEYLIRAAFFGLNLLFNLAMWTLFTAALTRASSTTRVSVINVSSNFMTTALLGWVVFGERLPPMWWVGAGLLAAGTVVIGRREEEGEKRGGGGGGTGGGGGGLDVGVGVGEGEGDVLLGEEVGGREGDDAIGLVDEGLGKAETAKEALRRGEDVDAPML